MLGKYIKWTSGLDTVTLPNPTAMTESYSNNEVISLSEAGTEIGNVTRLQKKTFTCTWNASSTLKTTLETMCAEPRSLLTIAGTSHYYRARIISAVLVANSEWADRTNGLWTIRVTLTEV